MNEPPYGLPRGSLGWSLMALAKKPRCMYSRSIEHGCQCAGQVLWAPPLTRFPVSQNEVALKDKGNALIVVASPCFGIPETGDLQRCGNGKPTQFAVKLKNSTVCRCLRSKRLVVYQVHAFGSKPMLPPVDCVRRNVLACLIADRSGSADMFPRYSGPLCTASCSQYGPR